MDLNTILEKYGLSKDTAKEYITTITYLNQTKTAEEIGVSRDTVNRYKNAFAQMKPEERSLIIASLAQERLLEQATE